MPQFRSSRSAAPTGAQHDNKARTYITHEVVLKKELTDWKFFGPYIPLGESHKFRILPAFRDGIENEHMNPEAAFLRDEAARNETRLPWDELIDETVFVTPMVTRLGLEHSFTYLSSSRMTNDGTVLNDRWSPTDVVTNRLMAWRKLLQDVNKSHNHPNNPLGWFAQNYPEIPRTFVRWFVCMQYGPVSTPSNVGLVQAYSFNEHGKDVVDEQGNHALGVNRVFTLSASAMISFMAGIMRPDRSSEALAIGNNFLGDWCSLEGGQIAAVYTSKGDGSTSYTVQLKDRYPLEHSEWVPWEEILHFPTVEEQIDMLITAFGGAAVDHCLAGSEVYAAYIPEEHRGTGSDIPEYAEYRDFVLSGGNIRKSSGSRSDRESAPPPPPPKHESEYHQDAPPPPPKREFRPSGGGRQAPPPPPPPPEYDSRETDEEGVYEAYEIDDALPGLGPEAEPPPPPPPTRPATPPPPTRPAAPPSSRPPVIEAGGSTSDDHARRIKEQTRERLERLRRNQAGGN